MNDPRKGCWLQLESTRLRRPLRMRGACHVPVASATGCKYAMELQHNRTPSPGEHECRSLER